MIYQIKAIKKGKRMKNNENKDDKLTDSVVTFIGTILAFFINGLIVYWLWNGIIPEITDFGTITYWQSIGLLILFNTFFGSNSKGS
jgi:hypothetical protein